MISRKKKGSSPRKCRNASKFSTGDIVGAS